MLIRKCRSGSTDRGFRATYIGEAVRHLRLPRSAPRQSAPPVEGYLENRKQALTPSTNQTLTPSRMKDDNDLVPRAVQVRSAPGLFGQRTSNATTSRFFERTVVNPELFGYGFETLTRALRTRAWNAAGNPNPALAATAAEPLIIDLDATLVTSHSDKDDVAGAYKGGHGFAPFIASADYGAGNGSGEILVASCGPATSERTAPRTTSGSSTSPPPNCPRVSMTEPGPWPGRRSWSAPTAPGPLGSSSGTCTACSLPQDGPHNYRS